MKEAYRVKFIETSGKTVEDAIRTGLKDLVCDLDSKTVTLTYDTTKTDLPTLLKAFEKIHKPAKPIQKEASDPKTESDANSGASTPD